jgi:hypothetical protein
VKHDGGCRDVTEDGDLRRVAFDNDLLRKTIWWFCLVNDLSQWRNQKFFEAQMILITQKYLPSKL